MSRRLLVIPAAAASAGIGLLSVRNLRLAVALAALPAVAWLVMNPAWTVGLAATSLPLLHDLGHNFAFSDMLLLLAFAGAMIRILLDDEWRQALVQARPLLAMAAPFVGWLLVLVVFHESSHVLLNTLQDIELTVFPMVLGAVAVTKGSAKLAVYGFVVIAGGLSISWLAGGHSSFAGDKNAAGQFIADAIIVALAAFRSWRVRGVAIVLLVGGLFFTESRGSVLAVVFGVAVLVFAGGLGPWRQALVAAVSLAALVAIVFYLSPPSVQHRVQSIRDRTLPKPAAGLSVGSASSLVGLTPSQYSVRLRQIYRHDGEVLAEHNLLIGVGVGNYLTGSVTQGTVTVDPHNVLIRTAAEGGVPDLAFFVVMVLGTAGVVLRRVRVTRWAALALAVQVAIITHGMLDVYWVRGTPVLGWLLIGMAVNPRLEDPPEPADVTA